MVNPLTKTKFNLHKISYNYKKIIKNISEFENLCHEISLCNKIPPIIAQAFQILGGSMMSENQLQIVMKLDHEFTFKSMKTA